MAKNKTFLEWLSEGHHIPDYVDEATASLINDWFCLRRIKNHFEIFFDRALHLAYPYYMQLLRIDPTKSSFDWFVQDYLERQNDTTSSGAQSKDNVKSISGDNYDQTTGGYTDAHTGTVAVEKAGKEINTYVKDDTDTVTKEEIRLKGGSITRATSGSDSVGYAGTKTTTYTGTETNDRTVSGDTFHEGGETSENMVRNIGYTRANPMSSEYNISGSDEVGPDDYETRMIKTDAAGNTDDLSVTNPNGGIQLPFIENPTTSSDTLGQTTSASDNLSHDSNSSSDVTTKSFTGRSDSESFTDRADTTTYGKQETESYSDPVTFSNGKPVINHPIAEHNTTKDTIVNDDETTDTKTFQNRVDTTTYGDSKARTYSNQKTTHHLDSAEHDEFEMTSSGSIENKYIHSGRHEDPAKILSRAKTYIMNSPAWNYLCSNIEPCFQQSYEDDMDELLEDED